MAYADTGDLLLGDIPLGPNVVPEVWITRAADEIDSRIGARYELPLPPDLAPHSALLLQRINAQLATGRLIMALDGGSDDDLHSYGNSLVRQALGELGQILNGSLDLVGAIEIPPAGARGPSLVNQDAYSATAAFEAYTMGGVDTYWRPGA